MENSIDLYFDKNYGKLYEKAEKGKAKIFKFENELGKITNQFLKQVKCIKRNKHRK